MHLRWEATNVQGRQALYGDAGPADGLPVVFLHGWAMAQHTYKRALKRLVAQGCRVLAPAMPGFGGTPNLSLRELGFPGYAAWLNQFLDAVGVDEPVLLIGHSFGGGVAITFSHRYPNRVGELVLLNSVGGPWRADGGRIRSMAERPIWEWAAYFAVDIVQPFELPRVLPSLLEDLVPNLLFNPGGVLRTGLLARKADMRRELNAIKRRRLPVVAISGEQDRVVPKSSFDALCRLAGAEGEIVPGSHSWMLADPERFGETLAGLVSSMSQRRAARTVA